MVYLILALLLYTAAILIGAFASRNANTSLVSAITNIVSIIIPTLVAIPVIAKKNGLNTQKYGILMAALGGIVISLFVLTLNKSFTQNKIGIITPVVFGGAILLSTLLSYFLFKEKITAIEGAGLVLMLCGFAILIYARATS
jgi:multidrug transporter EmrE-like cation transporter